METKKRRMSDRTDGRRIRDLDAFHVFMPYLLPKRADCEAFINEQIDITNMLAYLDRKNADGRDYKYTMFHVIAAALVKTVTLRPQMNRFIQGKRVYQRDKISLAFVAKKRFADDAGEALLYMDFGEDSTIDTIYECIKKRVTEARHGKEDNSMHFIDKLAKLPRWLLALVMGILRILDFFGKMPHTLVKEDPDYASIYISNLGSIRLNAAYHHLNNWGTNSLFVVIGEKHKSPQYDDEGNITMRETLRLGITLDERLADGYYYAKTIKLLKHLLQHPELLEQPAKETVNYE